MLQPAIFLDRDGVINCNRADHVKSWAEFEFLPGSLLALRRLAGLDWPVVVVTNQAMIGRGQASRDSLGDIHARMLTAVLRASGRIDAVMVCPHRPDEDCACRKPRPGMLLDAADALGLDLARSFMVGDAASDVMAALSAGCRPILVKTGRGSAQLDVLGAALRGDSASVSVNDVRVAENLGEAVEWITSQVAGPAPQPRFVPQRAAMATLFAQPGV